MKDLDLLKVFVYGTLKPGKPNYHKYCSGQVIEVNSAITPGQLFSLPVGYPAMTSGPGWVYGFVLAFGDPQVLGELDDYEDYQASRPVELNLYERQRIETFDPSGQVLGSAWAYLMRLERVRALGGTPLPDGQWR